MNTDIVYEFPLSERIRVFMRLEHLFHQLDHYQALSTVWDRRASINVLFDIITIFSRNNLKSEMLKELDRHTTVLSQISHSEGVDKIRLEKILKELQAISKELFSASGKIGNSVMKNDLFLSVTQRSSIPGSTCCFDLPAFHFWLEHDPTKQNHDLEQWIKPFQTMRNAIELVLNFIRQSSTPTSETAESGFFQANLDNNMSYQLLRISTERSLPYYAEISGGKHRFSVRFMVPSSDEGRAIQSKDDIPFRLTCCLF